MELNENYLTMNKKRLWKAKELKAFLLKLVEVANLI